MSEVTIYHNPRCSKSRQTLQLLEQHGIQPKVHLYLQDVLSEARIRELLKQLGFSSARELVRSKETAFAESGLNAASSEQQFIAAMAAHPQLIERPIVVVGERAKLGRPPEAIVELLS
ncbi:arsenate reductase (glutaredoxin) [Pseudidiomarina mangrovi]|uniref:arsenate reductase (glutaredoxin) n=1 Tax=Pseudidiomarina mangrovi TaxID=2487133 RepID=UPI000FCAB6DA|nr:arsenate reductase (glutaredoxin) [Pseudidiomarina mangrovi]